MSKYLFMIGLVIVVLAVYLLLPESGPKRENAYSKIVERYLDQTVPKYGVEVSEIKEGTGKECLQLTVEAKDAYTLSEARVFFVQNIQILQDSIKTLGKDELRKFYGRNTRFIDHVVFNIDFIEKEGDQGLEPNYVKEPGKIASISWSNGKVVYKEYKEVEGQFSLYTVHEESLSEAYQIAASAS